MSVNGITSNPLVNTVAAPRTDATRQTGVSTNAGRQTGTAATGTAALKPQAPIATATQTTVPAEAPAGTDPELWNVLTAEERTFFAKTSALGPLTYGRYKAATNPAAPTTARGVRLDVRA